jgi:hypothetical protein
LPFLEKVGCSFCGYTNGLLNYVTKIAGDTEKYWCGIKHSKGNGFVEPKHQKDFLEYNEEEVYKKL